jgi:splicing factor 3B subunit 3
VEEVPAAIAPFQGRVLIGVGKLLRVYDLGKKKLLRKCENKVSVFLWGRLIAPVLKIIY